MNDHPANASNGPVTSDGGPDAAARGATSGPDDFAAVGPPGSPTVA